MLRFVTVAGTFVGALLLWGCSEMGNVEDMRREAEEAASKVRQAAGDMKEEASKQLDALVGIDGAYEFVQLDTPDGPSTDQTGMMVVHDGYVCHTRAGRDRVTIAEADPEAVRMEKAARAFMSSNAGCGSFRLEGEKLTVNWTVSADPGIQGNTSEFIFRKQEDRIMISPAGAPDFAFVYRKVN